MKVLLISPLPPAVGGIARWSEAYLQWSKGEFETVVVDNALLSVGGSRWKRFFSQIRRTVGILSGLKKQLRINDIDIAHVNSSCAKLGIFRDYLCVKKLKKKNVPVILQCHCNIEDQLGKGYFSRLYFKKTVKLSSKVLVLNTSSLRFAKACGADDVCVCPNFIASGKIAVTAHNVRTNIQKAVYVGHLYKEKGVEQILEVAKYYPAIEFRLVGPYTNEYGQETLLPKNVVLTGPKDSNSVMVELDSADLFFLLSHSEGFSNAMLEAMARGVPVIATKVGAAEDMIEGKGGILVPVGDLSAAIQAVSSLNDVSSRKKMSQWNIEKTAEVYESGIVLNCIKKYYLEFLNEKV